MAKYKNPSFRRITQTIVHIQVEQELFNIHKDILVAQSPYFKAAFEGGFREAKDGVLPLDDVKISTMQGFLDRLYSGQLPMKSFAKYMDSGSIEGSESSESSDSEDETAQDKHAETGINQDARNERHLELTPIETYMENKRRPEEELYIFADRFDVPQLRKTIIEAMHKCYTVEGAQTPLYAGIIIAFKNLPASSPLCRLYIDVYTGCWEPEDDSEEEQAMLPFLPPEFLSQVMIGLGAEKGKMRNDRRYKSGFKKPVEDYYKKVEEDRRAEQ